MFVSLCPTQEVNFSANHGIMGVTDIGCYTAGTRACKMSIVYAIRNGFLWWSLIEGIKDNAVVHYQYIGADNYHRICEVTIYKTCV